MQVRIYDIDKDANETFCKQCDLRDFIPDDDAEYGAAFEYLKRCGRYYAGRNATSLSLIMNAER